MSELVYGLERPHRIGSICGNPCQQCGGGTVVMSTAKGDVLPDPPPLFIVREATFEEYRRSVIANGGGVNLSSGRFYYVVTTD